MEIFKKHYRKFLLLFVFLFFFINLNAQSEYEVLVEKLEVTSQSEELLNQFIEYYAKQSPEISQETWSEIRKNIEYSSFSKNITELFKQYYTLKEVKALIKTIDNYGITAYQPKPEVTQELYKLGKKFGVNIGNQIVTKLKELGY